MYVFCVLYGVVVYACICDDIPAGPCVLVVSNDMDMLTYSSIRVRCPYLQYTTQDILVFRWTLDRAYLTLPYLTNITR